MATSWKLPSISLNISRYLSEYIFKVSPSLMDIDNKESKGRWTLLHVIKRYPNAQVSSLKESIELAPRPSNHLIATVLKLDGKLCTSEPCSWNALTSSGWKAYMLHRVCSTIVHGERGLSEPLRESPSFNSARERWSENLVERFAYRTFSQASRGWALVSTLIVIVLIIREGLTRRCPWSRFITIILFIVMWETTPSARFFRMLGQTHVNGWSHVISSQNGGSSSYIFPLRLEVLEWSCHLFNY